MKIKFITLGLTFLFWLTAVFLHGFYHVKKNIAAGGAGYEIDPYFLVLGFISSSAVYYLSALFVVVIVELSLLTYFVEGKK